MKRTLDMVKGIFTLFPGYIDLKHGFVFTERNRVSFMMCIEK